MGIGHWPADEEWYHYSIEGYIFSELNEIFVQKHSNQYFSPQISGFKDLQPASIEVDKIVFIDFDPDDSRVTTRIFQVDGNMQLSCTCNSVKNKLCAHQARALYNLIVRNELRIFFDKDLRSAAIRKFAEPYGLHQDIHPEKYFSLRYQNQKAIIEPNSSSLILIEESNKLSNEIVRSSGLKKAGINEDQLILVLHLNRYTKRLNIGLFKTALTQEGKPKNPLEPINPLENGWLTDQDDMAKFYFALSRFQGDSHTVDPFLEIEALKAIQKNPLNIDFYQHIPDQSSTITASSISRLELGPVVSEIELQVEKLDPMIEISCSLSVKNNKTDLRNVTIRYDYFLELNSTIYLASKPRLISLIKFFKERNDRLLIHNSKLEELRNTLLEELETDIKVNYNYLLPATVEQIESHSLNEPPQKYIYLKDSDPYVEIDLVMKYGEFEIPILSKKQLYPGGIRTGFRYMRDKKAEINFVAMVASQHPNFNEQLEDALPYFYLHKKYFLDEEWFSKTFETWINYDVEILGFNKLHKNKLNPNPAKISVRLLSGIDWFNAEFKITYGKKKANLTQINRAIRNKSRYVLLDDGTSGMLPQEWIEKFSEYFRIGDLEDDSLKIAKSNFNLLTQFFEESEIDDTIQKELLRLRKSLDNIDTMYETEVPATLHADLRDYQKQGLNWLNFLDEFNLGGCLADDMGLGKTIQIIAFILSQREKVKNNVNLVVVPTSLIFNWLTELEKFAPSIKVYNYNREKSPGNLDAFLAYEVVIISYGKLLSEISTLKKFTFNYVFLDESQNIKNPDSQRYKAACLLKARNRIAITGTPIENNTFDLFGQLSFASPGLLGSKQYFKDIFSVPIDTFKVSKRAEQLQQKIKPFILRRTKNQVAKELPDKTEMIVYCEMGTAQRNLYDAFEREFRDFICSKTNEELPRSSIQVLRGLTRLRQICNSPALLNDEEIPLRESSKIETLIEQLVSKSNEHKILVFSQFVSMLDLIKAELTAKNIPFSYLTGKTKEREREVKSFQEDSIKRIFLISLKAGGTGLNLTQADYVYLVDPWWNPAVENQAIDRIYRIGQKKNVVAVRLICPDTIEEKIIKMQKGKQQLFDTLINSDSETVKSFTKESLLGLLNSRV